MGAPQSGKRVGGVKQSAGQCIVIIAPKRPFRVWVKWNPKIHPCYRMFGPNRVGRHHCVRDPFGCKAKLLLRLRKCLLLGLLWQALDLRF